MRKGTMRALVTTVVSALVVSAPAAAQTVVVRAGTLIDGTGGPPARNVMIVIQDGRLVSVGADVQVPQGAAVIDLSAMTVLPGFVDAHVHLTGPVLGEPGWDNAALREMPADAALRGAKHARETLMAGFTTVRNVGAGGFADVALRDAINAGRVPGPRMQAAGHSLGATGSHCDLNGYIPDVDQGLGIETGRADGRDEIFRSIRFQVKHGADVIKICATGGVLSEGDSVGVQQYTDEEVRAVVEAAHMVERRVAAHAHGNAGIKAAIRAGVTSIDHGSVLDDEAIRLMVERGTYLVPTLMAAEAVLKMVDAGALTGERADKAKAIAPRMQQSFGLAVRGGVKVALGTDAGVMPHGANGHEFTLMVAFGMTPMQAIVAGTRTAAELLGWEHLVGTVRAGRYADLVAVRGNPLENVAVLEDVVWVMKGGEVVKAP